MATRDLFHGANGDNILLILGKGLMKPDSQGRVFLSLHRDSVFMHGADSKRKASFAIKVRATIPDAGKPEETVTPGVNHTVIIHTKTGVKVQVVELYVREPRGSTVVTIKGASEIKKYLSARKQ